MADKKENKKLCTDCGATIPKARLEALSKTEYCVKCAANHPESLKHIDIDAFDLDDCLDIVSGSDD